ncbi:hypothetical protein [Kitasatospora sp. NPDC088346]|uniref:hypothetical protein n=1 Tax=Kitasatospora sp. NPDC088346 TaxID=3364073 RepID=UPI0037FB0B9F
MNPDERPAPQPAGPHRRLSQAWPTLRTFARRSLLGAAGAAGALPLTLLAHGLTTR